MGRLIRKWIKMGRSDTLEFETRIPIMEVTTHKPAMVEKDDSVVRAAQLMCTQDVESVIIIEDQIPIGIVTEKDITCKVVAADLRPSSLTVTEIMSTPLITISSDKTANDAAHMMVKHKVRRLPIIESDNTLIGIVTVRDLLMVSSEINDLLSDLLEINRKEEGEIGICSRCNQISDNLKRVDHLLLCSRCREEENLA